MDAGSTITLRSGHAMPVMGLGTWMLTTDTSDVVAYALKRGYRLIDTSGDYGTQPGIGKALRDGQVDRSDIYIVTKVEETEDAYEAAATNLKELGIDQADLILIHRPPSQGIGEDLWRGLRRAKQAGLTRDIGVSNYSIELLDQLTEASGERPAVNQIEWSPFGRSDTMLDYARENQVVIQAYSPLTRADRLDAEVLTGIGSKHGKSPAQVLIRWNLQQGTVPLPKANQIAHLDENLDVFDFDIDAADMTTLNRLNERYSALGTLPYE